MEYLNICKGNFIERPNRFVAEVLIGGEVQRAHVKNTGRCRELLVPGAQVYLEDFTERMGDRKMQYSLIGVKKGDMLVNMDSQAPNVAVKEALESGALIPPGMGSLTLIKGEQVYGDSRLDFYIEDESGQSAFVEVKGVTLEEDGVAKFPDAPTQRGVKHIRELIKAADNGYKAYALFLIQMKGPHCFTPHDAMHKEFGNAVREAHKAGVTLLAYDCLVTENTMTLSEEVETKL